ncbi:MAG TPA: rod shape-determining protein MreC [Nitrospiria bacterium]|nr:rod shape-determining protein MreC [Nitrospiria bacterium]
MLRTALTHRKWLILMLSLVAVMIVLSPSLQKRPFHFIGAPISSLLVRFQTGLTALTGEVGDVWRGYIALVQARRENQRFVEQLHQLQAENLRLQELALENSRLQQLLDLKNTSPIKLTAARVVGRDPTNWHKTVMINKGEQDGLGVDMGVITPAGVVGRVIRTTPEASQVLLLTDQNSSIAALVQRTRDEGLVEGTEGGLARMKYLPILSEVGAGDMILTSGLTGIFPKGMMIGQVLEVQKKENALFQVVRIKPTVDFAKIEEVLVILRP